MGMGANGVFEMNSEYYRAIAAVLDDSVCMMFAVRDGRLNLTTVFQSQDVDTGLRNDVYTMHALQAKMAQELGMSCRTFTNVALNLHLYESKWDKAMQVLDDWKEQYGQDESR